MGLAVVSAAVAVGLPQVLAHHSVAAWVVPATATSPAWRPVAWRVWPTHSGRDQAWQCTAALAWAVDSVVCRAWAAAQVADSLDSVRTALVPSVAYCRNVP